MTTVIPAAVAIRAAGLQQIVILHELGVVVDLGWLVPGMIHLDAVQPALHQLDDGGLLKTQTGVGEKGDATHIVNQLDDALGGDMWFWHERRTAIPQETIERFFLAGHDPVIDHGGRYVRTSQRRAIGGVQHLI